MTVGIVGAGQLGRMLALAGYPLGCDFLFLDPAVRPPGAALAPHLCGAFDDRRLLRQLARRSEVVTFDWENVSVAALRTLRKEARICPPLAALAASQDRVSEKRLFERLKIPTTRWRAVASRAALARAVRDIGLPGVLKTRRLGYDGKGQAVLASAADVERAWRALGAAPLLYEERVAFTHEVSIIGARSARGEIALYPLNGNVHAQGILRLTRAPYGPASWQHLANRYLVRVLEHFRYVGILAIEFFVQRGRLIANEMAPRVHNSGHWTIEGAVTSQFENHLRAILGLPLGLTRARGYSAMVNLIGQMPPASALLDIPGLHLHDYAKAPRPGRKLGHCTFVARTRAERDRWARGLLATLAPNTRIP
ncbi:MAG TPA: 5-(carboxyamino)imidazole ribonucleotide synthase [Steroidobacteraceae bacterium]|jgi:5-(carboxyamino)imidazole ribonucleotide synthase|nr:5-(carboxyamino)imidazole ribonucleotide synthase [Steroidobacteraceae bacterium]